MMKLTTLLLFIASLAAASFATPYHHKLKHLRVQEEVIPSSKYTVQWICEIRDQLIARVKEACSALPPDRIKILLNFPHWFCDNLDSPDVQQLLWWKCDRSSEPTVLISAMAQQQKEHSNRVLTLICNAIFEVNPLEIELSTACPVIETLTATNIRTRCPNVMHLSQTLLEQHLDRLQQNCHPAIYVDHSANIQWDKGMDFACKFYRSPGFIRYLEQLCSKNMPNYNIPNATLEKICEEAQQGNLVKYLNKTCSERRPDVTPARNQQEGPTVPVEHTDICSALSKEDMATAIGMVNSLCDRVDNHERPTVDTTTRDGERMVPPGEDWRIVETHWGLCVDRASLDRLKTLCLTIQKGFFKCPSTDIPALCRE